MGLIQIADLVELTLSGSITNVATSVAVASVPVGLPTITTASGNFTYAVIQTVAGTNRELVRVTDITGTTLTVVRGQGSPATTALAHAAGEILVFVNSVQAANAIATRDYYFAGAPYTLPAFTWVNQGTASVSTTNGSELLINPGVAGINHRLRVASTGGLGAVFTLTGAIRSLIIIAGNPDAGLIVRNSGLGTFFSVGPFQTGSGAAIAAATWPSATGVGAFVGSSLLLTYRDTYWLRIVSDGVNCSGQFSLDGDTWSTLGTTAFVPDQYGYTSNADSTSGYNQIRLTQLTIA